MESFLTNILSFPTAIFTVCFAVMAIYWLSVSLGLVDSHALDIDFDANTEHSEIPGFAGLVGWIGLSDMPATVIVSAIAMLGWLISYFEVHYFELWSQDLWLRIVAGSLVLVESLVVATFLAGIFLKPLKPFFRKAYATPPDKQLLGQTCLVRTGRVDMTFGEAVAVIGGASLIIRVRAEADKAISKDDKVVPIRYEPSDNSYLVIPLQEFVRKR